MSEGISKCSYYDVVCFQNFSSKCNEIFKCYRHEKISGFLRVQLKALKNLINSVILSEVTNYFGNSKWSSTKRNIDTKAIHSATSEFMWNSIIGKAVERE